GALAWQAARRHLDARPGTPRRRREELAAAEETGGRRGAATTSPRLLPDAGDPRRPGSAEGTGLAVRGQVGRLPRPRARHTRRSDPEEPSGQRPDATLPDGREGDPESGQDPRLRARRRDLRARRARPLELLADAAGQA